MCSLRLFCWKIPEGKTVLTKDNPIYAAAQTLSSNLEDEIARLKDVDQLDDFERRTKSLTALSKAVQTFNVFVEHLKSNPKDEDGSIGSAVEFREELARRINALVDIAIAGANENPSAIKGVRS